MTYKLYDGLNHNDERGTIKFFNNFDMAKIVRMYEISPSSTNLIRAWQGHQFEKKWFYCSKGSFNINILKIENFNTPSTLLIPKKIELHRNKPCVLELPGGYATGIKAISEHSVLIVFSNYDLEASKNDDFRFPVEKWSFVN